jgi:hypothetical protein
MPTIAVPNLLRDPGYLFWAPLASTEPTNTVVGSKFTDSWPVAWVSLGTTEDGTDFEYGQTVEPIEAAEFLDPLVYATTGRSGKVSFSLQDVTLANLRRAMNGGAVTVVSGTGATTLAKYEPADPGAEVRCMIGWESLDSTMRLICRQTLNTAATGIQAKKAPNKGLLACEFSLEAPSSGAKPFTMFAAGATRQGA